MERQIQAEAKSGAGGPALLTQDWGRNRRSSGPQGLL